MTGAHGRTFEDPLHLVVTILIQTTDLLRLFGTLQLFVRPHSDAANVEARLSRADWVKTLEFGEGNARDRNLMPEDVDAEISTDRSQRGR
jgi:hypothetical protein